MHLTNILLAKVKSKNVMVVLESLVSGYKVPYVKARGTDKVECIAYDPYIKADSVFREKKKLKGVKSKFL